MCCYESRLLLLIWIYGVDEVTNGENIANEAVNASENIPFRFMTLRANSRLLLTKRDSQLYCDIKSKGGIDYYRCRQKCCKARILYDPVSEVCKCPVKNSEHTHGDQKQQVELAELRVKITTGCKELVKNCRKMKFCLFFFLLVLLLSICIKRISIVAKNGRSNASGFRGTNGDGKIRTNICCAK